MVAEKGHQRHKKPRGTVATLKGVAFPKTFLQRVKLITLAKSLNRCNFSSVSLNGEHQAGTNRSAIK
jgi:hypothetical protein